MIQKPLCAPVSLSVMWSVQHCPYGVVWKCGESPWQHAACTGPGGRLQRWTWASCLLTCGLGPLVAGPAWPALTLCLGLPMGQPHVSSGPAVPAVLLPSHGCSGSAQLDWQVLDSGISPVFHRALQKVLLLATPSHGEKPLSGLSPSLPKPRCEAHRHTHGAA